MSNIDLIARFTIKEGMAQEFKAWSGRCRDSVQEKDTGTLRYDWYLNEEQTECVVLETYSSSAAVMEHAANLGALMGEGLNYAALKGEVFGEASDELKDALSPFGIKYYSEI